MKVRITETYIYDIDLDEVTNKNEALKKARRYYIECDEKYIFVADASSFDSVKFEVLDDK